jgi:Flp pilus assembly protein TadD
MRMLRSNSTTLTASIVILCALSGCGGAPYQPDIASPQPDNTRNNMNFASAAEAVRMASIMQASGTDAEALAMLAAAYRRFPNDAALISAYGRLAVLNGQDALAERLLQEALAMAPDDWRAVSAGGLLAAHADRQDDARRAFVHAREISGNDAVALNNLAISYILDGNATQAEALLRRALASPGLKDRHRPRVRRNLAVAMAIQGNASAAAQIAGAPLPSGLRYADRATLRHIMGLAPTSGALHADNSKQEPAGAPNMAQEGLLSWRIQRKHSQRSCNQKARQCEPAPQRRSPGLRLVRTRKSWKSCNACRNVCYQAAGGDCKRMSASPKLILSHSDKEPRRLAALAIATGGPAAGSLNGCKNIF